MESSQSIVERGKLGNKKLGTNSDEFWIGNTRGTIISKPERNNLADSSGKEKFDSQQSTIDTVCVYMKKTKVIQYICVAFIT